MEQTGGKGGHDSRLMRDLCTLLVTIIAPVAAASSTDTDTPRRPRGGMSPAGAASMLLGASMALMLCGSVTFAIGFLLMPWVAGVALLFGFAGVISTLSSGLLPSSSPASCKDKEQRLLMPAQGRLRGSAPPMSSVPHKLVAWR
ncbi:hypothetical protein D1007_13003 [Hordeum vulgare]|nr:hypothetical protein D1007_13003 [Hordeum vulgare]